MVHSKKNINLLSRQEATIDEQSQNNVTKAAYENHNRYGPRTG